ncbi:hypothetical protein ACOKM5_23310 [Streptomyces sp. BH097]|uniref:hypothetical protein n=1 Tax=unclassified Streptomyces TaxID=2593676 RepID=UPI003BB5DBA6
MTDLVYVLLTLAFGWIVGHSTARIRIVVVGATAEQDEAALALNDACCEVWWTSTGTAHEDGCDRARWAA